MALGDILVATCIIKQDFSFVSQYKTLTVSSPQYYLKLSLQHCIFSLVKITLFDDPFGGFAKVSSSALQMGSISTREKYLCELQMIVPLQGVCPCETYVCKTVLQNDKYFCHSKAIKKTERKEVIKNIE